MYVPPPPPASYHCAVFSSIKFCNSLLRSTTAEGHHKSSLVAPAPALLLNTFYCLLSISLCSCQIALQSHHVCLLRRRLRQTDNLKNVVCATVDTCSKGSIGVYYCLSLPGE
jgi:hypothetical protein